MDDLQQRLREIAERLQLTREYAGNELWRWIVALVSVLVVWLVLGLVFRALRKRTAKLELKGKHHVVAVLVGALGRTRSWFLFVAAVYAASTWVRVSGTAHAVIRGVFIVAAWLQIGLWASGAARYWIERVWMKQAQNDPGKLTTLVAFTFLSQILIWSLVLLTALNNLDVDITALVAGLGIGGIAVALAAQNILGDLFASLSIVLDRPFEVGDFIVAGDFMGSVERIGLKTTRVRSLGGEQIVFSNTDLLNSRVRNFKRMQERRIVFGFGLVYGTPADKVEAAARIAREAVEAQPLTRFDRAHFKGFGDSSLDYEVVYYVLVPDFVKYMDIQQAINLHLMRRFEAEGLEFAFPTRTLHVIGAGPATGPAAV